MKITPKVDDKKLQRKLDQQIREQPRQVQKVLGRTAEFLMGLIKQRTQRGKNADGLSFAPYKPEYKAFRREKGRQVNFPDLNFSGQMLSNMTQKTNPTQAIIFFANKFQAMKAVGNQKKRKFFAIGDRETTVSYTHLTLPTKRIV